MKSVIVTATSIQEAIDSEICPHCGSDNDHGQECEDATQNKLLQDEIEPRVRWALHPECGRVLVIEYNNGLCVIETDEGRRVSPIRCLEFGCLNKAINVIDDLQLSNDQIEKLINVLRIRCKTLKLPKYPELWPGCQIEVQMGRFVNVATITEKRGNTYVCVADAPTGHVTLNVSHKQIIGLI